MRERSNDRYIRIKKTVAIMMIIVFFVILFSTLMSVSVMAQSSPDMFGFFNHHCESESQLPDVESHGMENNSCCSLPCNASTCCVLRIFKEHSAINTPNSSAREYVSQSEQLNIDEMKSSIFKPPKS